MRVPMKWRRNALLLLLLRLLLAIALGCCCVLPRLSMVLTRVPALLLLHARRRRPRVALGTMPYGNMLHCVCAGWGRGRRAVLRGLLVVERR